MSNYINNINTYADLTAYNAANKDYPNVSYIQSSDEVKYSNPVMYVTFNSSANVKVVVTYNPSAFVKIEYNGQEIELVDTYKYQFTTAGNKTLKYTLADETSIPQRTFGWCSDSKSFSGILNTVTSIGESAFFQCGFTSVDIPNTVTSIGESAFGSMSRLQSLTIGNGVTTIGSSAFSNCTGLTSVTIGNGVTTIGVNAFEYAGGTTNKCTYTILATTPPTLGTNVFTTARVQAIYVPAESVNTYKAASGWSTYASLIQAIPNS